MLVKRELKSVHADCLPLPWFATHETFLIFNIVGHDTRRSLNIWIGYRVTDNKFQARDLMCSSKIFTYE